MPPVVLITLDGVRPDALTTARCPALTFLRDTTLSYIHLSFYSSARHVITSKNFTPMAKPLPGLVEVLRSARKRVAFFYNRKQLRELSRPGHIHL